MPTLCSLRLTFIGHIIYPWPSCSPPPYLNVDCNMYPSTSPSPQHYYLVPRCTTQCTTQHFLAPILVKLYVVYIYTIYTSLLQYMRRRKINFPLRLIERSVIYYSMNVSFPYIFTAFYFKEVILSTLNVGNDVLYLVLWKMNFRK